MIRYKLRAVDPDSGHSIEYSFDILEDVDADVSDHDGLAKHEARKWLLDQHEAAGYELKELWKQV